MFLFSPLYLSLGAASKAHYLFAIPPLYDAKYSAKGVTERVTGLSSRQLSYNFLGLKSEMLEDFRNNLLW